ncbi:MAG TPA: malto-oligosyltrehalose trehalohydrolase [Vicinamibacterales bacterium]
MPEWKPLLGACYAAGTTTFRVWAPDYTSVDLVIEPGELRPLSPEPRGYWSATFDDVRPGTLYRYRLEGRDDRVFPDPVSRFQPQGVHGPSQVIDPSTFAWTDRQWRAPWLDRTAFYEIHVGTFTPQGSFRGVMERLPYLKDLGISAIQLMPIADFPGDRNWGYDGVALFAPARCYGQPDDLRGLVDTAHRYGVSVYLDVVYNHLGPDGAYANVFSQYYFTDRHESPWGRGVNLDGPSGSEVRRFFIENALHWIHEYHIDGLRLDATHAMHDDSPVHFLAELTATVRERTGRPVAFVAEDHRNISRTLRPVAEGGWGIDAVWADDFHHQARVHTARDREGYYADFTGKAEDLAETLRLGWFFTGQYSAHLNEPRGTDPSGLLPKQFIVCIQNHDQIGNRPNGARLNHEVDEATFRALSALLLVAPQTPLLFMGQEWAASSPFLFFTDHAEELGRKITEGRRQEFGAFAAFADPAKRAAIPDPQDAQTFLRSRLQWDEAHRVPHPGVLCLYRRLLHIRSSNEAIRAVTRERYDVRALDERSLMLTLMCGAGPDERDLTAIVRLSGAGAVHVPGAGPTWRDVLVTTEDADVTKDPAPIRVDTAALFTVHFARPGAILFRGLLFAP